MITTATDKDLAYVKEWLKKEHENSGEGFWVNWEQIEEAHQDGRLIVLRDDGLAVALHTCGEKLETSSILVVHPDRRGAGIGTTLARHIIEKARAADAVLLEVTCAPETSSRFWLSLGFQLVKQPTGHWTNHAYLALEKELQLPEEGNTVSVAVQFFEANSSRLIAEHDVQGKKLADGSIALARRVIGFSMPMSQDIEVTVTIDGQSLFPKGRAKYLEAFGLVGQDGAFYIDRVSADVVVPA